MFRSLRLANPPELPPASRVPLPVSPLLRSLARAALALGLLAATARAKDTPGFTTRLGSSERAAAGLVKLSPDQLVALDTQIARELTVARQGDVVAFARSFMSRRSADQSTAAGLPALSPLERTELDRLVARAVAQRPPVIVRSLAAKARDDEAVETVTYKPQIHGEVSLVFGTAGGGRNFYGGSFTAIYDDPQRNLAVAFTYAEYHGKGLLPFDDCVYDRRGPFRR